MKIYRLARLDNNHESEGFEFFGNKKEADSALRKYNKDYDGNSDAVVEPIDFEPTKSGILALLNRYASHNDNG